MEYYSKGKNVEDPLEQDKIPIKSLPKEFTWMQVRGGSKIRNLLTFALKEFSCEKPVLWTGYGPAVGKTVTCAEIMKREHNDALHQITKICYRQVEEYWDPKIPELDQIVVNRKLPMIHILLSLEPLDTTELGYQSPGTKTPREFQPERGRRRENNENQGASYYRRSNNKKRDKTSRKQNKS